MKQLAAARLALSLTLSAVFLSTAAEAAVVSGGGSATLGVVNGNFETLSPVTPTSYCYSSSCGASLQGWTTVGMVVVIGSSSISWGTPSNYAGGATAGLGTTIIGLQKAGAELSQLVNLSGGDVFTLSWADASRDSYLSQSYQVSFDDHALGTFQTPVGQGWVQHSLSFAASGSGVLKFSTLDLGGGDRTSFIDNIQLGVALPEPASMPMVLLGLGGMVVISSLERRRRRR
jgi:hypothetical protein